ncbi:MAG: helix-turn-helix domain-containing protein [Anaerolineaceae bacterium]|nr:helix-turn-helix domain-containing protein [Anaerolineaceae bacterium]
MNDESSPIITIEEAADLLKIPVSSVYKLAQAGKIPAQKVGRHWRFHRQTLIQWIAYGQLNFDSTKSDPTKMDFS